MDVHHDWKSIDGGKDKVDIGRRMVGGLLMEWLVVSVMAGLMLDRRLVMRYAARGRGKVVCLGGGLDKGC